jgi:hypothetical protein
LLCNCTVCPPLGAAPVRVIVPVTVAPPDTLEEDNEREVGVTLIVTDAD